MILETYNSQSLNSELVVGEVEVLRDLHRQWTGCLVSVRNTQYTIEQVRAYRGNIVAIVKPTHNDGGDLLLVSLTHPRLDKAYPTLGYYNVDNTALYFSRRIARQWKKGAHENNMHIDVPFGSLISSACSQGVYYTVGYDRYDNYGMRGVWGDINFFDPVYNPSFEESISLLIDSEALSTALNKEVALAIHPLNGEIHVLYHGLSVGAVNHNERQLLIKSGYEWLSDTLRGVINYD